MNLTTEERLLRIEQMLEEMQTEITPVVLALGKLLIRVGDAGKQLGLNKDTLSQNDTVTKYEEVGHRRTYVEIGEIQVIKKRRKKKR